MIGFSNKRQFCFTYFKVAYGDTSFAAPYYRVHFSTPKAFSSQFSNRASKSLDASSVRAHFLYVFGLQLLGLCSD